jgi:hypothetical protein
MAGLDRDQLETLRRQIEEDYRMDMAAVERLQRRFMSAAPAFSMGNAGTVAEKAEKNVTVLPSIESQADGQPDELTNTLRGMFSSVHRR